MGNFRVYSISEKLWNYILQGQWVSQNRLHWSHSLDIRPQSMSFIDKADDVERKQINPTKISIPERWLSLKKKKKPTTNKAQTINKTTITKICL